MKIVEELTQQLEAAFPTGTITVADPMQDGAHLTATVIAEEFTGKPHIARHRLVYAALGDVFEQKLHALQLVTKSPNE